MKKRFLSVFLALVMCLCLLPTAALADEPTPTPVTPDWSGWTALTSDTTSITGGTADHPAKYYLSSNVTISSTITIIGTVTLDLNGCVLKCTDSSSNGSVIKVGNNTDAGYLTLTDSNSTAEHYFTEDSETGRWLYYGVTKPESGKYHEVTGGCIVGTANTRGVEVRPGSSFTMNGGNIVGGGATKYDSGGGVYIKRAASFAMTGGSILGCTSNNGGGGVFLSNPATFTMTGGSIRYCNAICGGGVYVNAGSQITLGGDISKTVTVAGNKATSVETDDIYLCLGYDPTPDAKFTVGEMANGSSFTVTRTGGTEMTYVGDLNLTSGTHPTTISGGYGYSWDSDSSILTLKNAVVGKLTLPSTGATVKGNGHVGTISDGSSTNELIFDGADLTVGSVDWRSGKVVLKNGCKLTVNDTGICAGQYDIQDTSALTLDGGKLTSPNGSSTNGLLNRYPDFGYSFQKAEEETDYTLYKDNSPVTKGTLLRYCEVNFYDDQGNPTHLIASSVLYGSTVTVPSESRPTKEGHTFTGWDGYAGAQAGTPLYHIADAGVASAQIKHDLVNFYPTWQINQYTVTFDPNGGTVDPTSATTDIDGKLTELPTPTRSGSYRFDGWFTEQNGGTAVTVDTVFTEHTTVYAHWTFIPVYTLAPTYAVAVSDTDNGTVTVSHRYAERGDTVTITVAPDKGCTLETLTVLDKNGGEIELTDKGDGKYTFKMPSGAVTVTAAFMEDNAMLNHFVDVTADKYYYDAVLWAAKNGITGGIDENHFGPDLSCTRAQLVTFLWRAAGCPVVNYAMDFSDVGDSYYTEAVRWAASLGIVGGYGNGLFGSDDAITREQFVTILYRFAVAMGYDVSVGEDTNILSYNDVFEVSEYAIPSFQWATGAGIVQGNDGNLMPKASCTRAQIVTMLYRLLGE